MIVAAKLFVELTWAEAGGVIVSAILAAKLVWAWLTLMIERSQSPDRPATPDPPAES